MISHTSRQCTEIQVMWQHLQLRRRHLMCAPTSQKPGFGTFTLWGRQKLAQLFKPYIFLFIIIVHMLLSVEGKQSVKYASSKNNLELYFKTVSKIYILAC